MKRYVLLQETDTDYGNGQIFMYPDTDILRIEKLHDNGYVTVGVLETDENTDVIYNAFNSESYRTIRALRNALRNIKRLISETAQELEDDTI